MLFLSLSSGETKMRGTKFGTPYPTVNALGSAVSDHTDEQWANYFNARCTRMKLCIQCDGDYFEKQQRFESGIFCRL